VSSVRSRVDADRLNRATQFASNLTALVDALQRERAISRGYVASAKRANHGAMTADRVLVDTALQSFQRDLRSLDAGGFSGQFRRDVGTASASLGDLAGFRSRVETEPVTTLQVAGYYGGQIDALLAVIGDIGSQRGGGSLGDSVAALMATARAKEAVSQAQGLLFSVLTAGTFGPEEYQQFAALTGEEQAYLTQFRLAASPAQREFFSRTLTGPEIARTDSMRQAALTARNVPSNILPQDWYSASAAKVDLFRQVELRVARDVAAASAADRTSASRRATADLVGMVLVVGLAVGSSLLLSRSMARPLVLLERRAREVAGTELPGVVERLQRAEEGGELTAIAQEAARGLPIRSSDEIGRLATAFNSVHRVAVRVATEQAALRKSIGDMFVNLARRSQSLIDRQLNLIEELERRTEDPDHLDELFRLDHLATRMRRNAENLLVLASAEPGRRWSEPIALADVLRAAGSEVEDFTRVELMTGDDARLAGHASSDVVHLLAELIENATTFSPPDTPVRVAAGPTATGYLIEIEDRGLGMTEEELASANERLANPPEIDFALSRMLGFFVVGRLAERHGIGVRLRHSWYGGITAMVLVPAALLLAEPEMTRAMAGVPPRPSAQLPAPVAWPDLAGELRDGRAPAIGAQTALGAIGQSRANGRTGGNSQAGGDGRGGAGPERAAPVPEAGSVFEPPPELEPPAEPPGDPVPAQREHPASTAPGTALGEGPWSSPGNGPGAAPGNTPDLFDDYRTGMVHGRVSAHGRHPGRPPGSPPADGSPPAAS
jgi:HAMP domain-containing protein